MSMVDDDASLQGVGGTSNEVCQVQDDDACNDEVAEVIAGVSRPLFSVTELSPKPVVSCEL